ncbi:MAG: hypothetical protein LUF90_05710 [Rikenellaceae bacterium]|nr:hypothetical protein [Rikenellaceae bacterium]
MKSVFISYNQALTDPVNAIMDRLHIRGYTKVETVHGRGSFTGEPHMGKHTWPAMNSAIITIVNDDKVRPLLDALRKLDSRTEMQGLRAFVWNIEDQL